MTETENLTKQGCTGRTHFLLKVCSEFLTPAGVVFGIDAVEVAHRTRHVSTPVQLHIQGDMLASQFGHNIWGRSWIEILELRVDATQRVNTIPSQARMLIVHWEPIVRHELQTE